MQAAEATETRQSMPDLYAMAKADADRKYGTGIDGWIISLVTTITVPIPISANLWLFYDFSTETNTQLIGSLSISCTIGAHILERFIRRMKRDHILEIMAGTRPLSSA